MILAIDLAALVAINKEGKPRGLWELEVGMYGR